MSAVLLHSLVGNLPAGYLLAEIGLCGLVLTARRLNRWAEFQTACLQLTLEVDLAFSNWQKKQNEN